MIAKPNFHSRMSLIAIVTALNLLVCKAPPPRLDRAKPPEIRVGILEQRLSIDFQVAGTVNFRRPNGSYAMRGVKGGRWRVEAKDSKPANFTYRLVVGTTKNRIRAEEIVRSLDNKGLTARIAKYERSPNLDLRYVKKTVFQVVLTTDFKSEKEARIYQNAIAQKTGSEIMAVPDGQAEGFLRFTNLDNKYSFDSNQPIHLETDRIEILDVDVGSGFHWQRNENRFYGGAIEFLLDAYGLITLVNELSLEDYLKGVVPSEMPVGFPPDALKAQAVTARVEAVAKIGLRHPVEPYDLCDDVHCQVFGGKAKQAQASDRAVESTRGIFMVYRDDIIEAFYAGVCGGHTENNENVWLMDAKPYLRGILDRGGPGAPRLSSSLQNANNLRKWVDSYPDVYCNTLSKDAPASVGYSRKYFRWTVAYSRQELQSIIAEKTGEDFGLLVDLLPLKRGVSGRLQELEVVGTKKRFVIYRELPIRQALSKNTLYSACFYVSKEGGSNGLASQFILKGAGWGHGVGMCQIGAAMMAKSGRKFDQILRHYYQGVFLEALYR